MRECGGCTLCCKLPAVEALRKPQEQWCDHCHIGTGCRIYDLRPAECRTFTCLWLQNDTIPEDLRPDKSKVVIYRTSESQIMAHVDPSRPDAWKQPRMYGLLNHLAVQRGFTVIIGHSGMTHFALCQGTKQMEELTQIQERK